MLVIYFEIITNVVNGVYSIIDPVGATQPLFATALQKPGLDIEPARWFGAVSAIFGGLLLYRALSVPAALKLVLEALCVGDFVYLGSFTPAAVHHGLWPLVAVPYALTVAMFVARMRLLWADFWFPATSKGRAKGQ